MQKKRSTKEVKLAYIIHLQIQQLKQLTEVCMDLCVCQVDFPLPITSGGQVFCGVRKMVSEWDPTPWNLCWNLTTL